MKKVLFVILTCFLSICGFAGVYSVNAETIPYTAVLVCIPVDHVSYSVPSELTINDTTYVVTGIGSNAFSNCRSLRSVTIPSTITHIDSKAFASCKHLDTIVVEEGNKVFDWQHACNAIINTQTGTLVIGTKNTIIPDGVTKIGPEAFYNCASLTSIKIPNGVTEIGEAAFQNCTSLTSVAIAGSVTTIKSNIFKGCTMLDTIVLSDGITRIESGAFDDTRFYQDEKNWYNGVLYIDNYLIKAQDLLYCVVREGTILVADHAFATGYYDWVYIKDDLLYDDIEYPIFISRKELNRLSSRFHVVCMEEFFCWPISRITRVVLPNTVRYIGRGAFAGCLSLSSVELGDSLISIGEEAFTNCAFTTIALPSTLQNIGVACFAGCSLNSITIPGSVATIPEGLFFACDHLKTVTIEEGVQNIENYAFYSPSLKSITLPRTISSIGSKAFGDQIKIAFQK